MSSLDGILGMGVTFILRDEFTRTSQKIKSEFQSLTGVTDNLSQKVASSMNAMKLGFASMAVGGSIVAPFVLATSSAEKYEKKLAELSAITGVTGSGLNDLGQRAQNLAQKFGGDVVSNVESMKMILSRLGPDIAKNGVALESMGNSVLTLSKTMNGDVLGSVNALTTGLLQYDISLQDPIKASQKMAEMMNVMAKGAQVGSAEVPQIAQALEIAGLTAKNAGISFEEFNAMIQVMGKGGRYGAEAGTALRNVMAKLGEGRFLPKDTMTELQKYGVDIGTLTNKSLTFSQRLTELKKIQKDSALISKLFGVENQASGALLLQNIETVEDWTKQLTGSNSATEQAKIIMASYSEAMLRTRAKINVLSIGFGQILMPLLTRTSVAFGFLLDNANAFVQSPFGKAVLTFTLALGGLVTAFGAVVVVSNLARFASLSMASSFLSLGNTFVGTAFATNGLLGGLKALTIQAYQSLLAFAPYIITFAVIAGAVYFAYRSFQAFQDVLSGTAKPANGLLGLMQRFGGVISAVIQIFKSWDGKTFDLAGMESQLKSLGILDFVLNLSTWIVRLIEFVKGIGTAFYNSFSFVASIVGATYKYIVDSINSFANALGFQGQWLSKSTSDIQAWIYAGQVLGYVIVGVLVVAFGYLAISVISALFPFIAIAGAVAGLIYLIYNWRAVVQTVTSWITTAFNYLANNLVTDISKALFWIAQNVPAYIGMAFRFALDLVVMYFTQFIPFVIGKFWELTFWVWSNVPSLIGQAFYLALQLAYQYFLVFIPSMLGIVGNFLYWVVTNVPYLILSAFMSAFIFVYNLFGEFFFSAGKFFYDFGANLVESIKNGILSMWDSFTGWLSDMIKSIPGIEYLIGETEMAGTNSNQRQQAGQSLNRNNDLGNAIASNKAKFSQPVVFDKTVTKSEQPIFNFGITLDSDEIRSTIVKKDELDKARN